ncbi:hypothetical protein BJ878DRAFT_1507 [Calycina marina]|uniref:GH64 domain-containing protein n=1 Tax=Calycina marina TaxID=1763456 RepID=A0A9P7ZCL3_9HELO|nr:hypothetical protein BJ878DRAFT_1507 [Calycina marina]
MATMDIKVVNRASSGQVYAYITGLALDNNNQRCLIKADGKTPYYPVNVPEVGTRVPENCAIKLGAAGSTTTITIPHLAGARLWFSVDKELVFLLNPGPALVEPSVTNPTDFNFNTNWSFAEFTFSNNAIYANISYVDFVGLPIALKLTTQDDGVQEVLGLKPDGLAQVVAGLQDRSLPSASDWAKCVYSSGGKVLRALSPNAANYVNGLSLFKTYYDPYVDQVWEYFSANPLVVDTHAQWGKVTGQVTDGNLVFPQGTFSKPNTQDIFSCSTGPFADNSGAMGPLTARISAGFNRSMMLQGGVHPDTEKVVDYYKSPITNHYARLVHLANIDGRGYAFPYDDVPGDGLDQSGFVNGNPKEFVVSIG